MCMWGTDEHKQNMPQVTENVPVRVHTHTRLGGKSTITHVNSEKNA